MSYVLDQMAAGFAPLAGGIPPRSSSGFEGAPFLSQYPMLGMVAQPMLARMMGNMGMIPMGVGGDQNLYDILRHRQYMMMRQQTMAQVADLERENAMRFARGAFTMMGMPFGAEQRRMAGALGDLAGHAAPMIAQMAPDLLDRMGGMRGSPTVMASRMMDAGRYQIDPVTGQMGLSPQTAAHHTRAMMEGLYSTGGVGATSGLSAGQLGSLYGGLAQRGLVGSQRATPEDLDKMALDPAMAASVRTIDVNKVKRSLQSYAGAIAAIRDIFGAEGRADAPMSQLLQSLEAMSMGSMAQFSPQRVQQMIRQTYNLARSTGVGLDNAMVVQQHAGAVAGSLGLEPIFAVRATQGGLAFGGAYRGQGLAKHTAWGAMSADELQQADVNLRLGAASSNMANRLAVAMRLSDTVGGFQAGSEAANLVEALRGRQTSYMTGAGTMRNMSDMRMDDFDRILTRAKGSRGQALSITSNDVREMLTQRFDNREVIDRYGLEGPVRNMQGPGQVVPFLAARLSETMVRRLGEAGAGRQDAEAAMAQVSRRAMDRIWSNKDMSAADFADPQRREARIATILEEELKGTAVGPVLARMSPAERQAFLRTSASSFYGRANDAISSTGYSVFQNMQNARRLTNADTLAEGDRQQQRAAFEGQLQDVMTPLPRGSALRMAMEAIASAKPGANLPELIGRAMGGVSRAEVSAKLAGPLQGLSDRMKRLRQLQAQIEATPDGPAKAALQRQLSSAMQDAKAQASSVFQTGSDFGLFSPDDSVTKRDTRLAMDLDKAVADQRGGLGTIKDWGTFWRSDEGDRFSENVGLRQEQAATIAERLVISPDMARHFGTEAERMSRELTSSSMRRRALALQYAGGRIDRLLAGDYKASDEDRKRIGTELSAMDRSDRAIFERLHAAQGKPGRQYVSNEQEAGRLLGMSDEESKRLMDAKGADLSPEDQGKRMSLLARTRLVAGARAMTAADEAAIRKGGLSVAQREEMTQRLGVTSGELDKLPTEVVDRQIKMAEEGRRLALASGEMVARDLAKSFGIGDTTRLSGLGMQISATPEGRDVARILGQARSRVADALKGAAAPGRVGGIAGLALRWREAMALKDPEKQKMALANLAGDLGINVATEEGRRKWEEIAESMQVENRAGTLGKESVSADKLSKAYERLRRGGDMRQGEGPGGTGGPTFPERMEVNGRLAIDWVGGTADMTAEGHTAGSPSNAAPPP